MIDFGDASLQAGDDYPDFIVPLARAVADGTVALGVGICGSGVGASVAANKVPGRARVPHPRLLSPRTREWRTTI